MKEEKDLQQEEDEDIELTEEQRTYIRKMLERFMELGYGAVYGVEDGSEKTVVYDTDDRKALCKSVCCSFVFALTKKDVEMGVAKWNPKRPYFNAKEEDGYCTHLDREKLLCTIWEDRPERCRNYDCRKDQNVWLDWDNKILNQDVFNHLTEKE